MFLKSLIPLLALPMMASAANSNQCLQGLKSPVLAMYKQLKLSNNELMLSVGNTCVELENKQMYANKSLVEKAVDSTSSFAHALDGIAMGAIAMLGGTAEETAFKNRIEAIRKNPDRVQRVHDVYELVSKYSQSNRSSLYWALNQVSNHSGAKSSELTEKDFSVSYIEGKIPNEADEIVAHNWVRVHLPYVKAEQATQYFDLDLDSNWYPGQMTLLPPRRQEISAGQRVLAVKECNAVVQCLQGAPDFSRLSKL